MIATGLEIAACAALILFGFVAAGWLGAVLLFLVVLLMALSFRFEP